MKRKYVLPISIKTVICYCLLLFIPSITFALPPTWESNFGTNLGLSDDSTGNQTFASLNFSFPFSGTTYSGTDILSVSSNGFVSIGGDNGNDCCSGDPIRLLNDAFGRVGLMWTDLNPGASGAVYINTFNDDADSANDRVVITWDTVYFGSDAPLLVQVQLLENGTIILGYDDLNLSAGFVDNVLIGVSPGGVVTDPGSIDLTANMPFNSGTEPTVYELFSGNPPPVDVEQSNIFFIPNGSGGWSVSAFGLSPAPTIPPDLQPASDTGTSNTDDITTDHTPTFDIRCSEIGNTITLYSDSPAANTSIGTTVCTSVGTESITASLLADDLHNISYTDTKSGDESAHSPSLAVTIYSTYTVGGTVSGLATGNTVVLQNNGGDNLSVNANGGFTFPTALGIEESYDVTVLTHPSSPNQTCTVTNGTGYIMGANVTDVLVSCSTHTHTVGGTVSGLATGNSVVLQNNAGDDLTVNANGGFTFPTALVDGSAYAVTVLTQPTSPSQTCSVVNGSGTLMGANVTNVGISCTTNTYTIGGAVTGLATGNGVMLQNNAGDNLMMNANGLFTFATALTDGSAYNVTVLTQPTSPNQTCSVTNGSGTVSGANVTNVSVTCTTTTYTVGGTVTGLAAGNNVVLQNNAGDDLTQAADGSFTFATALADGSAYAVTVKTQPTTPNQMCSVANGNGTIAGANITNVTVTCTTNTYTVGGTVTGLAAGNSVVLQNNAGDDLTQSADGSFTFAAALADGSAYAVTVLTQPTSPNQTCSVTNGSGTVAGANVTNVSVTCTTTTYTVGGTVTGLAAGNSVVLQNNAGDDLTQSADGNFTFATALADGSTYAVTVLTQPTTPDQVCSVTNGSGTVSGANVTNVMITCATSTYTVGGTVTGLAAGNSVVLQNNAGDDLTQSADGSFTFATALADGSAYAVMVKTQPTTPNQSCSVSNGSGTITGANITNVAVTCTTTTYTVGGTVAGLAVGNSVVLQNNAGDDLTQSADGSFTFATALADGSTYAVAVLTQPTTPDQVCSVTNGSGTVSGANVTNVMITCATSTYTVGGTVTGLAAGNSVVLQNNAGDDLTQSADGSFTFATALADGSAYAVTVLTQPTISDQTCSVTNGDGIIEGANIISVTVVCVTNSPDISVSSPIEIALEEGAVPGEFVITRTGSAALPFTVNFTLGGTATEGDDYEPVGTSVVIPAGESSVTILIVPIDDGIQEPDETVILTLIDNEAVEGFALKAINSPVANRVVGPPATITIINNANVQPIPTLQEWALILLSFLLLMVSRIYSRKR